MPIDFEGIKQGLLDAFLLGIKWMVTIKSPDETTFLLWLLSWTPILISLIVLGFKLAKHVREKP